MAFYETMPIVVEAQVFNSRLQPWPPGVYVVWTSPVGSPHKYEKLEQNEYLGDFDGHCAWVVPYPGEEPIEVHDGDYVVTHPIFKGMTTGRRSVWKPARFAEAFKLAEAEATA